LKIVKEQQNSQLRKGWVHDFTDRHLDELQICHFLSQEDMQMAVPRAYLEEHTHLLKTHVTGKVAELVFNLDELGSADWEDRKANKGITPAGVSKEDGYQSHIPPPSARDIPCLYLCGGRCFDSVTHHGFPDP
jgi:hypothetical protein